MATEPTIEDILVSAGALFRSDTPDDLRFKVKAYLTLEKWLETEDGEEEVDRIQILAQVEDFAGFRPAAQIWDLVWQLGIFARTDRPDLYRRRPIIYLSDLFSAAPGRDESAFTPDFYRALQLRTDGRPHSGSPAEALRSLRRALHAVCITLDMLDRDNAPVPPPFLSRSAEGGLSRLSPHPSLTTAADVFSMLVELPGLVPSLASTLTPDLLGRAEKMLSFCVGQITPVDDPWGDGGALRLPTDEDFPGGDRPTVPANALFVIAARLGVFARLDLGLPIPPDYEAAVPDCVRFLLRMQSPRGGWGVYVYDPAIYRDAVPVPEEPFFTNLVVTALTLASKGLDEGLRQQCRTALSRCGRYLSETAFPMNRAVTWTPAFSPDAQPDPCVTAQTASALLRIAALEEGKAGATLRDLALRALDGLVELWHLGPTGKANQDRIRFRSPTESGASGVVMTWEQPGHAKIVSALTDAFLNHGYRPPPLLWDRIEQAVAVLLAEESGGFWLDYGMEDKVNLPNSANCALAIGRYLAAVRRLLSEPSEAL